MLGLRETFTYLKCGDCGCLQIESNPANLHEYYPREYYSYQWSPFRNTVRRMLIQVYFGKLGFLRPLSRKIGLTSLIFESISKIVPAKTSRILDVGSGRGEMLLGLHAVGFTNLLGIDPFLDRSELLGGVRLLKAQLSSLSLPFKFDLIIFNHSFEHIWNQLQTLVEAKANLAVGGTILIRVPVLGRAFFVYGENAWTIDAPRHFYVHTLKSMTTLASAAGLRIVSYYFDSEGDQFEWSSLYARDIAMSEVKALGMKRAFRTLTLPPYRRLRHLAERLNNEGEGDQAVFYLRTCPPSQNVLAEHATTPRV